MTEETEIPFFPRKEKKLTIIYEDHDGMSFNMPFEINDTMLVWKSRAIVLHTSISYI